MRPDNPATPRARLSSTTNSGSLAAGSIPTSPARETSGVLRTEPPGHRSRTQLQSDTIWKSRHEHSAFVFKDKIWIAGGHARPLDSEVWSLHVPEGALD